MAIPNTLNSEHRAGEIFKDGKVLTVFLVADDNQTDPATETVCLSDWLETAPVVGEIGSLGGDDRWQVVEVQEFRHLDAHVHLAIVTRTDLPEPNREQWLSVRHGKGINLYLDEAQQFLTAELDPDADPPLLTHLITHPYEPKSFKVYFPCNAQASQHFERLHLVDCKFAELAIAA